MVVWGMVVTAEGELKKIRGGVRRVLLFPPVRKPDLGRGWDGGMVGGGWGGGVELKGEGWLVGRQELKKYEGGRWRWMMGGCGGNDGLTGEWTLGVGCYRNPRVLSMSQFELPPFL